MTADLRIVGVAALAVFVLILVVKRRHVRNEVFVARMNLRRLPRWWRRERAAERQVCEHGLALFDPPSVEDTQEIRLYERDLLDDVRDLHNLPADAVWDVWDWEMSR